MNQCWRKKEEISICFVTQVYLIFLKNLKLFDIFAYVCLLFPCCLFMSFFHSLTKLTDSTESQNDFFGEAPNNESQFSIVDLGLSRSFLNNSSSFEVVRKKEGRSNRSKGFPKKK